MSIDAIFTGRWLPFTKLLLLAEQEILRVDREKKKRPVYRAIHFNCHDFAISFAALLVDQPVPISQLRDLSWYSEHAKYRFCRLHAHYSPRVIGLSLCLSVVFFLAESVGVGIPRIVGIYMAFLAAVLVVCHVLWEASKRTAERARFHWRSVLQKRFPLLDVVCVNLAQYGNGWASMDGAEK